MRKLISSEMLLLSILVLGGIFVWSCKTGIEPSPEPGVVRVTLQSDPADTTLVIVTDTLGLHTYDRFGVTIFQGKLYRDSSYILLFPDLESYRTRDQDFNVLEWDSTTGTYMRYTVYETEVPPGNWDKLEFGMTADQLKIGTFRVGVELPTQADRLMTLAEEITIAEGDTTVINLQIQPFQSVARYGDQFIFNRKVQILSVQRN